MNPLTNGGRSGVRTLGPLPLSLWALGNEDCFQASMRRLKPVEQSNFFRNPLFGPGMGLGNHLVTIRILKHPLSKSFSTHEVTTNNKQPSSRTRASLVRIMKVFPHWLIVEAALRGPSIYSG